MFTPDYLLVMAILFLTAMPIHEWAHAWAAYQLGDDTAALQGRLTINPLAHLDPLGAISLLLGYLGWGKPVPVVPHRLRGNRRFSMALVGAAGPFSNFVMAMIAAIPFRIGWLSVGDFFTSLVVKILVMFISINVSLMVFNLIPIPPLDGSRIFAWLLPPEWAYRLERMERYGGVGMMFVIFLLSRVGILGLFMDPIIDFLLRILGVY
jgi:Zn-dependent protease